MHAMHRGEREGEEEKEGDAAHDTKESRKEKQLEKRSVRERNTSLQRDGERCDNRHTWGGAHKREGSSKKQEEMVRAPSSARVAEKEQPVRRRETQEGKSRWTKGDAKRRARTADKEGSSDHGVVEAVAPASEIVDRARMRENAGGRGP